MNRLSLLKRLSSGISLATCLIFLSSFSAKSEDIVIWGGFPELQGYYAVSYTHLTLPTICSV